MKRLTRYLRVAMQLIRLAFDMLRLLELMNRIGWLEWFLNLIEAIDRF